MTRAIPRVLGGVPSHDATQVGTGGGTLVELAVAWEMIHKRQLDPRPLVVLGEFWRPIIAQIESADGNSRGLVRLASNVPETVEALRAALGSPRG